MANRFHGTSASNMEGTRTVYREEGQSQVRQRPGGATGAGHCLRRITAIGPGREALLGAVKLLEAARMAAGRYPVEALGPPWKLPTTPALAAALLRAAGRISFRLVDNFLPSYNCIKLLLVSIAFPYQVLLRDRIAVSTNAVHHRCGGA